MKFFLALVLLCMLYVAFQKAECTGRPAGEPGTDGTVITCKKEEMPSITGAVRGTSEVRNTLASVLEVNGLDQKKVQQLMDQHGFDEASLLELLASLGQSATITLDQKNNSE
jgi:hypothetical protein